MVCAAYPDRKKMERTVIIMNPNFEARNPNIEALNNYPCRARAAHSKNVNDVSRNFLEDGHRQRAFPANTLITLQRLQSLAFGFGTFAYSCKRPSFLASRRFATGKPAADALTMYPGYAIFYVYLNSNIKCYKQKSLNVFWILNI